MLSLKKVFLHFFILSCLPYLAYAESLWTPDNVQIKLQKFGTKNCQRESDNAYLCDGKTILSFDPNSKNFVAVVNGPSGVVVPEVLSVSDSNSTIFESTDQSNVTMLGSGIYSQKQQQLAAQQAIQSSGTGSKNFNNLKKQIETHLRASVGSLTLPNQVHIKLADGSQKKCLKSAPASCDLYICNGTGILRMPDLESGDMPEFIELNSQGLAPLKMVQSVSSNNKKILDLALDKSMSNSNYDASAWPKNIQKQAETFEYLSKFNIADTFGLTDSKCNSVEFNSAKQKINLQIQKIHSQLNDAQIVQVMEGVDEITGAAQSSRLMDRSAVSSDFCEVKPGVFVSKKVADKFKVKDFSKPDQKVLTKAEAEKVFSELKNNKDIPYGYLRDGCTGRAHVAADILSRQGIAVGKVWVSGENLWPQNRLKEQDPPGQGWEMHVAPFVYVKNEDGSLQKMVLDPSTQSGPVTVEEFANSVKPSNIQQIVKTQWPPASGSESFGRMSVSFTDKDILAFRQSSVVSEEGKAKSMQRALEINRDSFARISR